MRDERRQLKMDEKNHLQMMKAITQPVLPIYKHFCDISL